MKNMKKMDQKHKENVGEGCGISVIEDCLILDIEGDLDHHNAMEIRLKADKKIEKENIKRIIFNFENSNFMDSSGIGMIMGRYKRVIFTGGKVAVANVKPSIDRIFQISGLYKIIEKYNSVEEAQKAM